MAPEMGKLSDSEQKLFQAVNSENLDEVKGLLNQRDVNADCLDDSGMTPLQTAAFKGNNALCRILLAHGANVNSNEHKHGYTALMFAALSGKTHVVQTILEAGAKVHYENSVNRNAAQMAAFVGQHQCVSVINNFFSREDLEYYTKPQGLEKEPKLPPALCTPLYKLIGSHNLNPVKMSLVLQSYSTLLENHKPVLKVLELLVEKMMKQKETNETMAVKFHYLYKLLKQCWEWSDKNDGNLDSWVKRLCKGQDSDGTRECMEKFLRDVIKSFPYIESQLFQQMIRTLTEVNVGDEPTALTVLTSSVNGSRFASDDDNLCSTCSAFDAEKKCSQCKVMKYCDQKCQKLDWPTHKKFCKKLNERRIEAEARKEAEKKAQEEAERLKAEAEQQNGDTPGDNAPAPDDDSSSKVPTDPDAVQVQSPED